MKKNDTHYEEPHKVVSFFPTIILGDVLELRECTYIEGITENVNIQIKYLTASISFS